MPSNQKKILVVYEITHVDTAASWAGDKVLCLDFSTERALIAKGIPHLSLREIVDSETGEAEWWELATEIVRKWYLLPAMKFFEYEGIRIAEAPEPIMQEYLARLFYYVRIYLCLKKKYPTAHLYIPTPETKDPSNRYYLASFMPWTIVDAARMVGFKYTVNGTHAIPKSYTFLRASWKSFFLRAYNAGIGLLPRRTFKVYASEYWTHVAPIIPYLKGTELVILEHARFLKMPWQEILTHRIRIRYSQEPISVAQERFALQKAESYRIPWQTAKKEVAAYLQSMRDDLNWDPFLEACEYLVTYAPRIIADIDTLRRIMKEEKPNIVLQMASTGGPQHYFFLMARIAKQLSIPSLELQHAGATIDPRSAFCRIETDYLATYGKDVNEWHERIGHSSQKLIAVGSPRFDICINERAQALERGKQLFKQLGLDIARPTLLIVVPFSDTFATAHDSYQLAEFFETVRSAQENNPGMQVLFKFRTYRHLGRAREHLPELFPTDSAIAGDEDLFSLLCASDVVMCNNTTSIYQALLAKRPLILYAWKTYDTYHAQFYKRAAPLLHTEQEFINAVSRIITDVSYREELLKQQELFLERYSFDGKSSERVAKLLRDISKQNED